MNKQYEMEPETVADTVYSIDCNCRKTSTSLVVMSRSLDPSIFFGTCKRCGKIWTKKNVTHDHS